MNESPSYSVNVNPSTPLNAVFSFLNAVFSLQALFDTRTSYNVEHTVISFMAGVFVNLTCYLTHRYDCSNLIGKCRWVIDGKFVIHRVIGDSSEFLGENHIQIGTPTLERALHAIKVPGFDDQSIAFPITS